MATKTGTASELRDVLSSGMIVDVKLGRVFDPWLNTEFSVGGKAFPKDVIEHVCLGKNARRATLLLPGRPEAEYVSDRTNLKVQRQLRKIAMDPVPAAQKKTSPRH